MRAKTGHAFHSLVSFLYQVFPLVKRGLDTLSVWRFVHNHSSAIHTQAKMMTHHPHNARRWGQGLGVLPLGWEVTGRKTRQRCWSNGSRLNSARNCAADRRTILWQKGKIFEHQVHQDLNWTEVNNKNKKKEWVFFFIVFTKKSIDSKNTNIHYDDDHNYIFYINSTLTYFTFGIWFCSQ